MSSRVRLPEKETKEGEKMMREKPAAASSGAEAFVETLNTLGVERIFFNPGFDQLPLMGTIAKFRVSERKAPRIVLCPHESIAVSAAHGCAMASGKPQVVAVWEDGGTLQGGGAIVNLKAGRVPVVFCVGANVKRNPRNWLGEAVDQRKIVRDYVKWDHEVSRDEDISSALREAFRVASAEPCGPVYLTLAEGVSMERPGENLVLAPAGTTVDFEPPSTADLQKAVEILAAATNPLIMTAYSGRHPQAVASLVELAETVGARVITTDLRMNFPSTHPLCPGIDSIIGETYDHYIGEADVLLLVDYDFPGPLGKRVVPRDGSRIVQIDMEPLKNGRRLWDRLPEVLITGDSAGILPVFNDMLSRTLGPEQKSRAGERALKMAEEHASIREGFRKKALDEAGNDPISLDWLCHCINEEIGDDAILVHMLPSNADALSRQISRTKPGTIFSWGDGAGSMGWPLGAALGAKLAAPDKMVVSLIGDGGFIYGCPVAAFWTASAYHAPFLSIVFNNNGYAICKQDMPRFAGEGIVKGDMEFEVGFDFKDPPDYASIATACHGYGRKVEDPSEVRVALRTAIDAVRAGKPAVLDVRI
jgi:acetolactate synthase-1/2/3 large subunit